MPKAIKKLRDIRCETRFDEEEYRLVLHLYKQTTCRSMSEYIRALVFRRKVQIKYRNESMDQALEDLTDLRMDLKKVLVHMEETREQLLISENPVLCSGTMEEIVKQELLPAIKRIMEQISNFSDIWWQYSRTQKV